METNKSILAVRNDRFGEFLLIIPALEALKKEYPEAKITLAVNPAVKELAELIECVDQVLVWDEDRKGLRKFKFDSCIIFNPSKEAHIDSFLARIPVRVGYDRKWGFLLTHKIKDTKHLGNRHEVICNLELVECLGNQGQSPSGTVPDFRLNVPNSGKYDFLSRAIAIHPFTSDPVKQWPLERFLELAERIMKEMGVKVVFVGRIEIGTPPYRSGGCPAFCGRTVPTEAVNLINKTSLVELAQVLKQCKLLVTCDSGPMHLAAAVKTPVIALFRNDLPGKTAKRWGPWGEGYTVIERTRLEDISVDELSKAVKERL